jgi:hypothetical protein
VPDFVRLKVKEVKQFNSKKIMLTEKAGANAGLIWNALDGKEGLTFKEIKKETKQKKDDFLLGLGWLLREGKIAAVEVEEDVVYSLK